MQNKLTLAPQQKQQLTVHLVQQMHLLQMNALEVEAFLQKAVEANPLLEFGPEGAASSWRESDGRQYAKRSLRSKDDEPLPDPASNLKKTSQTLQDAINGQISFLKLPPKEAEIARYIAGTLDGNGYWKENPADMARAFAVPENAVLQALQKIQQMDPAGVGARNLSECLRLQLVRQDEDNALAQRIVTDGLEALGQNQIAQLAKQFHTTKEKVLAAKKQICCLNPKPGASFAQEGPIAYAREDVRVETESTGLVVTVYDTWGGKFTLNQAYLDWGKQQTNAQVKAYLKEQFSKAKELEGLLKERNRTLLTVFQALVTHQEAFFRMGPGYRQPLKLADLAEETGFAISTVSRALQHKFVACRWGSFPAGSFLVGDVKKDQDVALTDEKLMACIREVITAEDKTHPLSDQGICDELSRQGIQVARRTVNKYRTKMGIGGKSARKEWR